MSSGPPLAPVSEDQQTVYLVLDDFGGRQGRSWRETDEARADRAALIIDLLDGQNNEPVRVIAFNADAGWCRDFSQEVADLIVQECGREGHHIPPFLEGFVERHSSRRTVAQ
jgi:DNA-binding NarL/FixJ family response regulator